MSLRKRTLLAPAAVGLPLIIKKAAALKTFIFIFSMMLFNVNNIAVVMYFSKNICRFFVCFEIRMPKISEKNDKFLLYYSNIFGGPFLS